MTLTNNPGRVAGLLYTVASVPGFFALMYVPRKILVRGNAAATVVHVLAADHGCKAKANGKCVLCDCSRLNDGREPPESQPEPISVMGMLRQPASVYTSRGFPGPREKWGMGYVQTVCRIGVDSVLRHQCRSSRPSAQRLRSDYRCGKSMGRCSGSTRL